MASRYSGSSYSGSRRGGSYVGSAARAPRGIARKITVRSGSGSMLTAELLAAAVIVGIRVVGDYEVSDQGVTKGTLNTPANGGYGPFSVIAGLIASFFLLSFLAARGGWSMRIAVAIGGLIDIVLLMHSMDELKTVASFVAADPATRTVATAAQQGSTLTTQPYGAASAVTSSGSGVSLDADYQGSPGYFTGAVSNVGLPFATGSSSASTTAAPGASSTGPAVSSTPTTSSTGITPIGPIIT